MKTKITAINRMKLEFDARPENERPARSAFSAFLASVNPDVEELTDLRTVLSEAVTNAIIHGYPDNRNGKVTLIFEIYGDLTVVIKVKDRGKGIENIAKAREPLFTTDTSGERGGMGFAIMESFTDKISVFSKPDCGTTVIMKKKLKRSPVQNV